jgi:hypothetical protein
MIILMIILVRIYKMLVSINYCQLKKIFVMFFAIKYKLK